MGDGTGAANAAGVEDVAVAGVEDGGGVAQTITESSLCCRKDLYIAGLRLVGIKSSPAATEFGFASTK